MKKVEGVLRVIEMRELRERMGREENQSGERMR
jgi:hypothetical protein